MTRSRLAGPKSSSGSITHPDEAKSYLDLGVKHFCIGTDVGILFQWFVQNGKAMRGLLGRDTGPAAEVEAKHGYVSGKAAEPTA